jgi:hypothetical protein
MLALEKQLQEHSTVALLTTLETTDLRTKQIIILPRGCIGTVVQTYPHHSEVLVEFADTSGRAFALLDVPVEHLMMLVQEPVAA